ncbi:hypothetical protein [Bacillus sp. SJS]|uniref:hypothetical protein n=1 Tax=Bacillus sp. SJS TaxID=1423321 RepID=UPI0004DD0841|nr:hypothetical protein [Bacillus sp. SJS]KZZ85038.1 hypothetical protein AS29_008295 [Bacillus sp. SJS]
MADAYQLLRDFLIYSNPKQSIIVSLDERTNQRPLNESNILTEGELAKQLLDDAIEEVTKIDKGQVKRFISLLPQQFYREQLQTNMGYLENLVESLE